MVYFIGGVPVPNGANILTISLNGANITLKQLLEEDHFNNFKKLNWIKYTTVDSRYSYDDISFDKIETKVGSELSYEDRAKRIQSRNSGQIETLRQKISESKDEKSKIELKKLKDINESEIEKFFTKKPEMSNEQSEIAPLKDLNLPVIRYLILEGYINENYNEYISLFHEVNLTQEDFHFRQQLLARNALAFNYKLNRIENLVEKIPNEYFQKDQILNYDLLDFLADKPKYKEKFDSVMKVLSPDTKISLEFIEGYIKRDKYLKTFIQALCKTSSAIWESVEKASYTTEEKNGYLKLILQYADSEDIYKLANHDSSFSDSIASSFQLISDIEDTEKIKSLLKKLNIKFIKLIEAKGTTDDLFDFVYQNNLYKINSENIKLILTKHEKESK